IEHKRNEICENNSPEPLPKSLVEAWKDHLCNFQSDDVEFSVQGENFYACSSILSKRSKYFARILSGQWAESTVVQNEKKIESEISNNCNIEAGEKDEKNSDKEVEQKDDDKNDIEEVEEDDDEDDEDDEK